MRSFLIIIVIVSLGIVLSLLISNRFVYAPVEDYIVANTIPRYPNLVLYRAWEIETHANLVAAHSDADATIVFYTKDASESVIAFYKKELLQRNWQIWEDAMKTAQEKSLESHYDQYEIFTKNIDDRKFELSILSNQAGGVTHTTIYVNNDNIAKL